MGGIGSGSPQIARYGIYSCAAVGSVSRELVITVTYGRRDWLTIWFLLGILEFW